MAFPVGSLISGGLGFLGSMLGASSQSSVNKRMAAMYEKSLAFNKYQYEDSKRYNSLPNQVNLMRQAGVNPALALGSGVSSSSASPVGAPSPASQSGVDYSSYLNSALTPFGSAEKLNQSQQNLNDTNASKANEEAIGQSIENRWIGAKRLSEIYNLDISSEEKKHLIDTQKLTNSYLEQSLGDRLWEQKWRSELVRADAAASLLNSAFLPTLQNAQLNNLVAQTALAYSQGKATLTQAHAAIMNARNAVARTDAEFGDTSEKRAKYSRAVFDYLIQQREESEAKEWSASWLPTGQNVRVGSDLLGSFSYGSTGVQQRSAEYQDYKSRKANMRKSR